MSIKNIIDGSYKVDAPIEEEKLSIGVPIGITGDSATLYFLKVGNICTLIIDFNINTALTVLPLDVSNEAIKPFKPSAFGRRDFNININNVSLLAGAIDWFVNYNLIEITIPFGGVMQPVSSNFYQITYNC